MSVNLRKTFVSLHKSYAPTKEESAFFRNWDHEYEMGVDIAFIVLDHAETTMEAFDIAQGLRDNDTDHLARFFQMC